MAPDRPRTAPLHHQVQYLDDALKQNVVAQAVLAIGAELALPNWYLGAGGIAQTVWNLQHGFEPAAGIKDYDLVYFDPADLGVEAERQVEEEVAGRLSGRGAVVDVKNQTRVHLWYEQRFGPHVEPFTSTEEAIATWPTTASSVGVRRESGGFVAWAPFGLTDLLGMVVPQQDKGDQRHLRGEGIALGGPMAKAADRSLVRRQLLPEGLRRARADSSPTVAGTEARRSRIEARLLVTILCGQGGASEQPERRVWPSLLGF